MGERPLEGKVAVVAGATRGAGRGIAKMLGEAGAVVYCTGRSSRGRPNESEHHYAGRPETIEETAELVDAAGGTGIPVRVDHRDEAEVKALFARVKRESKRLDVLANLLTGPPVTSWKPFWKLDPSEGSTMVAAWLWRDAIGTPDADTWGWERSETPCFTGRAVAALAADPSIRRRSGGVYATGTLAREYAFTDLDGSRPDMNAWIEAHGKHVSGPPAAGVLWRVEPAAAALEVAAP